MPPSRLERHPSVDARANRAFILPFLKTLRSLAEGCLPSTLSLAPGSTNHCHATARYPCGNGGTTRSDGVLWPGCSDARWPHQPTAVGLADDPKKMRQAAASKPVELPPGWGSEWWYAGGMVDVDTPLPARATEARHPPISARTPFNFNCRLLLSTTVPPVSPSFFPPSRHFCPLFADVRSGEEVQLSFLTILTYQQERWL